MKTLKLLLLIAVLNFSWFAEAQAQSEADYIRSHVTSGTSLPARSRNQIQRFYADRAYQPAFVRGAQLLQAATELRNAVFSVLPANGLIANDYWSANHESFFNGELGGRWLQAELALAQSFVEASIHLDIGRLDPKTIAPDIKFVQRTFSNWSALQSAIDNEGIASAWSRIVPRHDHYKRLQTVLARLRTIESQGGFKAISVQRSTLKIGTNSSVVRDLKERAYAVGYRISNFDTRFDDELATAIRDIQSANLAAATGQLGPSDTDAWEYFSVTSARRIQQVELNLEKIRWLPTTLETRHIFVNLATQELQVVDPANWNPLLKNMRVIVGRADRKTPSMRDEIKSVVLNPKWTVPPTVFAEDKLSAIRDVINKRGTAALDQWFAENRFVLVDANFNPTLRPTQIDWLRLDPKSANFYIVQTPSYDNALGVAKILLGNPWAIYLHDTNARDLFSNAMRSRSSGCIRLHKPIDLVEYLLQSSVWTRQKIDDFVAKPGETRENETWAKVPAEGKLPVYTVSLTARLGDDNVMRFTRDVYKQNLALLEALQKAGYYRK